jgi:hypothetical protein
MHRDCRCHRHLLLHDHATLESSEITLLKEHILYYTVGPQD